MIDATADSVQGRGERRGARRDPSRKRFWERLNYGRMAKWMVVWLGALLAWTLMVLAAVWQGAFLVLFFPAGWCLHAALRQYRELRNRP